MLQLLTALPSKLIVIGICSALFWLGGFSFLAARRFIMPTILCVVSLLISNSFLCLTMLSCIGIYCLGYGDKSPLRHIFGNGWGRGVWGLLAAICLSLALLLTHHIPILFFVLYLALNFTLENALKNMPQVIGDPIIGAGFSSIVILIH